MFKLQPPDVPNEWYLLSLFNAATTAGSGCKGAVGYVVYFRYVKIISTPMCVVRSVKFVIVNVPEYID